MPGTVNAGSRGQRMVGDADIRGDGGQCLAAIGTENRILSQQRRQCDPDVQLDDGSRNLVRCTVGMIARHEDRNLFARSSAFAGLA